MRHFEIIFLIIMGLIINSISAQTSFNISNKTTGDTLLTIDNNGRVGIGTTTPVASIDVNSSTVETVSSLRLGNLDNSYFFRISSGNATYSPLIRWHEGAALRFAAWTDTYNEFMRLTAEGNLGIGTTTPSTKLEVADTIFSSFGGFMFPDGTVQETAAGGGISGNTLDQAYDQGGAGAGRIITADAGAFEVDGVDGALFTGTYGSGTIPAEGAGTRMMWYPGKAAIRAGYVNSSQWDDINIGIYSTAVGYVTTASADYSTAMGRTTAASGYSSTAMGSATNASGTVSTAMGGGTEASGSYSTATGFYTTASQNYSTAMGFNTIASGNSSTAMGYYTTASGHQSTAMGRYISISGIGSFAIGDASTGTASTFIDANIFIARFANGYNLYTNDVCTLGVSVGAGGTSWNTISDSTKKENFRKVDGEDFLNKISRFNLTSWNYKGQDPSKFRHYGPMAQDFYAAFGNDGIGTIGNDTTIASADFDGVNLIAIQALEKRTAENKSTNKNLERITELLTKDNQLLKDENKILKEELSSLKTKIEKFESLFSKVEELTKPNNNQYAKIKDNLK